MIREYNEDYELRRYVWKNYNHALTARERALYAATMLELKARHASSPAMADSLRQIPGYFHDQDVDLIASMGLSAFQQQCCERLLREFSTEIFINRCERCHRILPSPISCACIWCGHHWYDRRPEMKARAKSSIYPAHDPVA